MASTTFTDNVTVIYASWLNDVNVATYTTIPTLAPLISPSFTTPSLGVATCTKLNKLTFTQPATGATLTIADGKTFTASNTVTITATDGSTLAIGAGGTLGSAAYQNTSAFVAPGAATGSGLTMNTNKLLGRTTASSGAIEEISVGSGLSLSSGTLSSTAGALILLYQGAFTATANFDQLNIFSSTYDDYLIEILDMKPSATDVAVMRFATGGTVDSGSNYYTGASSATFMSTFGTILTGGKGGCYTVRILNANSTSGIKIAISSGARQSDATPTYAVDQNNTYSYVAANTISGFRIYWNSGTNHTAGGKVRVYGYQNS